MEELGTFLVVMHFMITVPGALKERQSKRVQLVCERDMTKGEAQKLADKFREENRDLFLAVDDVSMTWTPDRVWF